ncbi:MAG: hypothetical protein AAB074_13770 [Planctomycetota bacterium]
MSSVLPLRLAYDFGMDNGLGRETSEIKVTRTAALRHEAAPVPFDGGSEPDIRREFVRGAVHGLQDVLRKPNR